MKINKPEFTYRIIKNLLKLSPTEMELFKSTTGKSGSLGIVDVGRLISTSIPREVIRTTISDRSAVLSSN